ncbi:hypothetical protein D3C78_19740 [compost metagenome]
MQCVRETLQKSPPWNILCVNVKHVILKIDQSNDSQRRTKGTDRIKPIEVQESKTLFISIGFIFI